MSSNLIVFLLFISCFTIIVQRTVAQNYCDSSLCSWGRHIGCGNSGRFQGCNGRTIAVEPYADLIVQLHNENRNRVASGQLSGFPSALQMASMQWDPELSRLAVMNTYQCRMKHDSCRNTQRFRYSGQNLAIFSTTGNITPDAFIRQSINNWFNEYRQATRADVERYRDTGSRMIGHFTAMVHEKNTHVGCGIATWPGPGSMTSYLLACNYAVTNMINNPIYRFGTTGSQCRSGRNPKFNSLCSNNEQYNHNQWTG